MNPLPGGPIAVLDIQKIIAYLRERDWRADLDHNVREPCRFATMPTLSMKAPVLAKGSPEQLVSDETSDACILVNISACRRVTSMTERRP